VSKKSHEEERGARSSLSEEGPGGKKVQGQTRPASMEEGGRVELGGRREGGLRREKKKGPSSQPRNYFFTKMRGGKKNIRSVNKCRGRHGYCTCTLAGK
jgi:hypothetical protein